MNKALRTLLLSSVFASCLFWGFSMLMSPTQDLGKEQFNMRFFGVQHEIEFHLRNSYAMNEEFKVHFNDLQIQSIEWIKRFSVGVPNITEEGDVQWFLNSIKGKGIVPIHFISEFDSLGQLKGWQCISPDWREINESMPKCKYQGLGNKTKES